MTVSLRGHDNSNYVQQSSKKYVFKEQQKTGSDAADAIYCGRLLQIRTAATGKTWSLLVESRVVQYVPHLKLCIVII